MPVGVYIRTEETRARLRAAKLGKHHSKETKAKIGAANRVSKLRKPCSEETKVRISVARKLLYDAKGRKTPLRLAIRQSLSYRQWKYAVFTRDNFTCQDCGRRGGDLEAHHIKAFATICNENKVETLDEALACVELWNDWNGRTLCTTCHKKY
jgi:5-methylcytosine-specific restriction endonuclease McrA